ncbi:MAG: hypothetical protein Q9172_003707 [Xanthocarpia lactea]
MPNGLEDDQERTAAWLQWPAHVPPPATKSTNDDTPSLQQYNIICQTICLSLVTVLLILRIYTKGRVLKSLGWDDYTAVFAWDRYGAGKHLWDISEQDYIEFIKWIKTGEIVYVLDILVTKISILLLYFRIFQPSRTMRIIIHINLWTNVVVYAIGFGTGVSWFVGPKDTGKVNGRAVGLVSAIFNSISDIAILILPISMVWKLHMPRKRKLAISAVFATAILGCVASVVRLALYATNFNGYSDPTWQTYPEQLWS